MSEDNKFILSEEVLNKVRYFIQDNDLQSISRNLRKIFFDYLRFRHDNEDSEFGDILNEFENLLELLDMISDESKSWRDEVL